MMRWAPILALCTGLSLPSGIRAEGDSLRALGMRDQILGWEAVGRVETGTGGFCTGTLVATDLVLTAAHCLFDPTRPGTLSDIEDYRFRAGLRNGEAVADRSILRAVVHPDFHHAERGDADSIRHDVALLVLEEPIPAAEADPFLVAALPAARSDVAVVSFARGRSEALSIQRRCAVTGRGSGLFEFNCDVAPGSSGAPVFDMSGGRGRIVSVVSSGYESESGVVSYGMELPGLVRELTKLARSAPPTAKTAGPPILKAGETRAGGARFLKAP